MGDGVRERGAAGPFTLGAGLAAGLSRGQLRGPRYKRLSYGVFVPADLELTHEIEARGALAACPTGVLSHATAVLAHGLPLGLTERPPARPHLSTPLHTPTADREAYVDHVETIPAWQVTTTPWGRTTSPARTYLDRAAILGLEDQVALGDAILHRGLASQAELTAMVEWGARRRGVVLARRALPFLNGRAEAPTESWMRVHLWRGGVLPHPEVNVAVHDEHGGWLARGDLVWRVQRLIAEYDGAVHGSERARRGDARRRALLTAAGWTVLTFTADDILRQPQQMVALVRSCLERAARD